MKIACTLERPFDATRSAIAMAFAAAVERMPAGLLPERPPQEVLRSLIDEALLVSFLEKSCSPVRQTYWQIELETASLNRSRRVPIELPSRAEFVGAVKAERGRRWFDKQYRMLAPGHSASRRRLAASATIRASLRTVECWSVAEMLHRLHGWHGLLVRVRELSFEGLLLKHGGELLKSAPKPSVHSIFAELADYLQLPRR